MPKRRLPRRMGELLVSHGLISESQLSKAVALQAEEGAPLVACLATLGLVNEEVVAQTLSDLCGLPFLPLEHYDFDVEVLELVPVEVAERLRVIPVERIGQVLSVAMADPTDHDAIEELERVTNCVLRTFIATSSAVQAAIERWYRVSRLGGLVSTALETTEASSLLLQARAGVPGREPERRQAARVPTWFALLLKNQVQTLVGRAVDLSASGVRCRLNRSLPVNGIFQLTMELPDETHHIRIHCDGIVVRAEHESSQSKDEGKHIALTFNRLNERERTMIIRHVIDRQLTLDAAEEPKA
ncbi:MAG TPA: PilZ domain-containing protein [bacterium]